jgi:SAM-dependent methyltransferase
VDAYDRGYGIYFPYTLIVSAVSNFISTRNAKERKLNILDIGCGVGSNAMLTRRFPHINYTGVDISSTAIINASNNFFDSDSTSLNTRIKFIESDTLEFLHRNEIKFDLIIDRASLQHHSYFEFETSARSFFRLINSSLSSDGRFISLWSDSLNKNMTRNFLYFQPFRGIKEVCLQAFTNTQIMQIETKLVHPQQQQGEIEVLFQGDAMKIKES